MIKHATQHTVTTLYYSDILNGKIIEILIKAEMILNVLRLTPFQNSLLITVKSRN